MDVIYLYYLVLTEILAIYYLSKLLLLLTIKSCDDIFQGYEQKTRFTPLTFEIFFHYIFQKMEPILLSLFCS